MGGFGSGQSIHIFSKTLTQEYPSLDVRWLYRKGLLDRGDEFPVRWYVGNTEITSIFVQPTGNELRLRYSQRGPGGGWDNCQYQVPITRTNCHYGGQRPWFLCPAEGCSRRVALLYGGSIFACRNCHNLAYPSQREAIDLRLIRKADKIRERMGWPPGILNPAGGKPLRMHWRTYFSLLEKHNTLTLAAFKAMNELFSKMGIDSIDEYSESAKDEQ